MFTPPAFSGTIELGQKIMRRNLFKASDILPKLEYITLANPIFAGQPIFQQFVKNCGENFAQTVLDLSGQNWDEKEAPSELVFFREFSVAFLRELFNAVDEFTEPPGLSPQTLSRFLEMQTFLFGSLRFDANFMGDLWFAMSTQISSTLAAEAKDAISARTILEKRFPAWAHAERIHLHLAEDSENTELPFVFLITVATRVVGKPRMQHIPISRVVSASLHNSRALKSSMGVLKRGAQTSSFMRSMYENHRILGPTRLSTRETFQFLCDFSKLEDQGFVIKLPQKWLLKTPASAKVTVIVGPGGKHPKNHSDRHNIFQFSPKITVDGEDLTDQEVEKILSTQGDLVSRWRETLFRAGDVSRAQRGIS